MKLITKIILIYLFNYEILIMRFMYVYKYKFTFYSIFHAKYYLINKL